MGRRALGRLSQSVAQVTPQQDAAVSITAKKTGSSISADSALDAFEKKSNLSNCWGEHQQPHAIQSGTLETSAVLIVPRSGSEKPNKSFRVARNRSSVIGLKQK